MDISVVKGSRDERLPLHDDATIKERPFPVRRPAAAGVEPISTPLLRAAAREAGLFQRSVLGHLDHHDWLNRVRADGQRLTDLLHDMGFSPGAKDAAPIRQ